jgi:hypothetical protein
MKHWTEQAAGRILLTGAAGYIGGRLLRKPEKSVPPVRCMVRRPEAVSGRTTSQTEIVYGDVLEPHCPREPFAGVTAASYLVHSMAGSGPFVGVDRRGAENFAAAAQKSGVSRIVYLGGIGAEDHLHSPREPSRGGADPARVGCPDDRVSLFHHHRLGKRRLRDRALARRALACPRDPALGGLAHAADRGRERPRVPAWPLSTSAPRQRRVRRPHAGVCAANWSAARRRGRPSVAKTMKLVMSKSVPRNSPSKTLK